MSVSTGDLSFLFKHLNGVVQGLVSTHVDDVLAAGLESFNNEVKKINERLDAKPGETVPLTFYGMDIIETPEGSYKMCQIQYADKLHIAPHECSFALFRSRRYEMAWITHTRSDVQADVAILAQVTSETFLPEHVNRLNKAVYWIKDERNIGLPQQ